MMRLEAERSLVTWIPQLEQASQPDHIYMMRLVAEERSSSMRTREAVALPQWPVGLLFTKRRWYSARLARDFKDVWLPHGRQDETQQEAIIFLTQDIDNATIIWGRCTDELRGRSTGGNHLALTCCEAARMRQSTTLRWISWPLIRYSWLPSPIWIHPDGRAR
jgi:hypothetical protein